MPTPTSPSHPSYPPRKAPDGRRLRTPARLLLGAGAAAAALLVGFFVWRTAGPPLPDRLAANRETAQAPDFAPPPEQIPGEMEVIGGDLMSTPPDVPLPFAEEKRSPEPRPKEPARAPVIVDSLAGSDKPAPDPAPKEPARPHRAYKWAADQVVERRLEAGEDQLRRELSAVPELRLLSDPEVKKFRTAERDAQDPEGARRRAAVAKVNAARENANAARRYLNANRRDPDAVAAEQQATLALQAAERELTLAQAPARVRGKPKSTAATKAAITHTWNCRLHDTMRQKAVRAGLALCLGRDCQLNLSTAAEMARLSKELRDMGFGTATATSGAPSPRRRPRTGGAFPITVSVAPDRSTPRKTTALEKWCEARPLEQMSGAVPTLAQVLQIEDEETRSLLVSELSRLDGAAATAKLAERALVDLSPTIRQSALTALKERPASQYLPALLWGLRYPWPPVADHAAVALRTLGPREAVAPLVGLLDLPAPSAPALDPATKQYKVREVVRLNHLRNCLLCHCPSANRKDGLVRGLVPTPGEALPQLYYESQTGDFVRADITYLRQDFSLRFPAKDTFPWPREQRFDFVTRLRPAKSYEIDELRAPVTGYPQRDAVLYALRGITGKDAGGSSDRWRELLGIALPEKGSLPPTGPAAAR